MAVTIFLAALSMLSAHGMRVAETSTGIVYEYKLTNDSWCGDPADFDVMISDVTVASCQEECNAMQSCRGFSRFEQYSTCEFFTGETWKMEIMQEFQCYERMEVTPAPTPAPTATIHGDPHVVNIRGDHFDIKRPGSHDLLLIPAGLGDKLHLTGNVTGLGGDRCSKRLYFTRMQVSGSFLRPMNYLVLSTSGYHFNGPDTVGLSVDGSANMSIPEFIKKVPSRIVQVAKPDPAVLKKPNAHHQHSHVDTLLASMSLGPVKLTMGWAHTWSPQFNWMWLEVKHGLSEQDVGGIMGSDDFTWASSRPDDCTPAPNAMSP